MNAFSLAAVLLACAFSLVAAGLAFASWRAVRRPQAAPRDVTDKLVIIEAALQQQPTYFREEIKSLRETSDGRASTLRQEVQDTILKIGNEQRKSFAEFRTELAASHQASLVAFQKSSEELKTQQSDRLLELGRRTADLSESLKTSFKEAQSAQTLSLDKLAKQLADLTVANEAKQDAMRETLRQSLEALRKENEEKLEKMRLTVDEKLQGTLDQRLGESFKLVSERLDTVHKGLGEMQQLATGVGDLKRVLTNVKSRGGWAEVQLGALLENLFTPDQYASNVRVKPNSNETVEFAIRLPHGPCWLPIDAKFPHEDWDRLQSAQDGGDPVEIEKAVSALERVIRVQAQKICEKYVCPPETTDFAIMYLPTEGLFAEVIRRPGFVVELQHRWRVSVMGPTTLSATLSGLQMGFRTLAIEKRTSDIAKVLGQAKTAFEKYGDAWLAVDKKLDEAKKKVADVGVRHRDVSRKLRDIDAAELLDAPLDPLSLLPSVTQEEVDADAPADA